MVFHRGLGEGFCQRLYIVVRGKTYKIEPRSLAGFGDFYCTFHSFSPTTGPLIQHAPLGPALQPTPHESTRHSAMSFRKYGKNEKVVVVYRDRSKNIKVERAQIVSSGTDQLSAGADMYRYEVRTRWGTLSDFTSLNVLDASCVPVKANKGDDGWSELSLSNHSQELIREYVNILTSLDVRHRKTLLAKDNELLACKRQCDALKQREADLVRQVAALQRQLDTQSRMRSAEAINTSIIAPEGARKRKKLLFDNPQFVVAEEAVEPLIKLEAPSANLSSSSSSSSSSMQSILLTKKPSAAQRFTVTAPTMRLPAKRP